MSESKVYFTSFKTTMNENLLQKLKRLIKKAGMDEIDFTDVVKVNVDEYPGIAKKFGLSVDDLKNLNNLNSNLISIGQKLLVTDNLSTNNSQSNLNDNYYIVNKGDTLYSIAKKFNVSVNSLQQVNNLNSTLLQINQKLIIPSNKSFPLIKLN